MRTAQVLITVPNLVHDKTSGEFIRKRGHNVIELPMILPASAISHGELRRHTEAEIELFGLQHSCIQADVYHAGNLLASYQPAR